eukprot:333211_1
MDVSNPNWSFVHTRAHVMTGGPRNGITNNLPNNYILSCLATNHMKKFKNNYFKFTQAHTRIHLIVLYKNKPYIHSCLSVLVADTFVGLAILHNNCHEKELILPIWNPFHFCCFVSQTW